jgi:hypothetical protein
VINIWREQALHEAGHATAAAMLSQDILSVEIRHGGGGLTRTRAPRHSDRQAVRDFVVVAYGGIAASEAIVAFLTFSVCSISGEMSRPSETFLSKRETILARPTTLRQSA